MPLLTPSRLIVLAVSLSLFSVFWTLGIPRQYPQPGLPIIDHEPTRVLEDWESPPKLPFTPQTRVPTSSSSISLPTRSLTPEEATQSPVHVGAGGNQNKGNAPTLSATTVTPPFTPSKNVSSIVKATPTPTPLFFGDCKDVPGAQDVMIILRTNKAEIHQSLPAHVKALLDCAPKSAIFSDHAGEIDGHQIHDIIDHISNSTKGQHNEFRQYLEMQTQTEVKSAIKDLDRWKFLPMAYKAHRMEPYARFYMFIEADTSLSWTNLLQWIGRLDYRINYYAGSPMTLNNIKFAQRGAGILLSQGALRLYAKKYDEIYETIWEKKVGKECCGDMILSSAMAQSHVEYYSASPLLQSDTPARLQWTEDKWCAPIVTWHHMSPADITKLWDNQLEFTKQNSWTKPYLFRDAFADLVSSFIVENKEEWDNFAGDTKIARPTVEDPEHEQNKEWMEHSEAIRNAAESWEGCQHVCDMAEDCFQWRYSTKGKGVCFLNKTIRLGQSFEKKEGEPAWRSGWMTERIKQRTGAWTCKEIKWKFNQ